MFFVDEKHFLNNSSIDVLPYFLFDIYVERNLKNEFDVVYIF